MVNKKREEILEAATVCLLVSSVGWLCQHFDAECNCVVVFLNLIFIFSISMSGKTSRGLKMCVLMALQ